MDERTNSSGGFSQGNPLLTTKLYAPPVRPGLVPRLRLTQRLKEGLSAQDSGFTRKLTLVSAPAGFGKTTLLSEWAQDSEQVAWLSLDEDDNDPSRFLAHVVASLQTVQAHAGEAALAALQSPQGLPTQAVLTALINDLAIRPGSDSCVEGLPPGSSYILVLDDYHVISAPRIHQGVAFLLEHAPNNLHVVISTRADPPLPIFRLRARGQLCELRSADLRFTADEAAMFLNTVMGLNLAPVDVEALESRTEGWIVGLQLAALSLRNQADPRLFINAFGGSHHYVLEYLTNEVVRRQSEPVQRFLIQTSILDHLCGPLCDALTGADDSQAMLGDLERRNLFIVPLDDELRWYRYHHLFADLLGNLRREVLPPDGVQELHRRASAWHEREGDLDHAIKHALQAQDLERAASLIERAAQLLIAHGRLTTLLRWIAALPEDLPRARPRLRLYQGWALHLSGQTDRGKRILEETRATLRTLPPSPENEALRGQTAALLTGVATLQGEPATVTQEARQALACLPKEDRTSRARVYIALGTAYAYQDDIDEATRTWQQGRDLALEAGNPFLATAAIEMLAGTQIYHQGRLRPAAHALQQVLDLGTTPDGQRLPLTGTAHALLGEIHLERNDLAAAEGYLETAIELLQRGGISHRQIHTFCAQARLERALGHPEGALQALRTAEQALRACPMWHIVLHLAACQVQLRLWLGDVETAARWARGDPATVKREIPPGLPAYLHEVRQTALARVHLARGETERALGTLSGLAAQAQDARRLAHAVKISLLEALAWQAQGASPDALASLERALSWAEPEGYVRSFLEAGDDVIPLLRRAARRKAIPGYARRLLAAFSVEERSAPAPSRPRSQALTEPLTPRELDVLELIRDGYANRDIAEALFITLNTVKKHTSNIYGKLGVKSRTQAVARARRIGLL